MADSMDFEFNIRKALQSITLFIFASLILYFLIILTDNKLSAKFPEHLELLWLISAAYFSLIIVLLRRLYIGYFHAKPRIVISDQILLIPNYYLGIKKIPLCSVYSMESFFSLIKSEHLVIGLKNKGRYFVDEILFANKDEFNDFKKIIAQTIENNAEEESAGIIKNISSAQQSRPIYSTYFVSFICLVFYLLATSFSLELPENADFILQGAGHKRTFAEVEFYRIFSSPFLHVGVFHLLINLMILGIMGEVLERVISPIRFINIFLWSCLIAYGFFLIFSKYQMGVGASGGVFGLWGAYFSLKLRHDKYLPGSVNAISLKRLIWLFLIEFFIELFILDNVGVEVHLGGFLAGFTYLYLAPLGDKLETVDQPTLFEKGLCATLVSAYALGLSYFILLYYGVI